MTDEEISMASTEFDIAVCSDRREISGRLPIHVRALVRMFDTGTFHPLARFGWDAGYCHCSRASISLLAVSHASMHLA